MADPRRPPDTPSRTSRFGTALTISLIATVLVVLFGAVVRITGSGAGCGQHWPTCQGEVAHLPRTVETLIEFTHRITSGLLGLAVFGLTALSFRLYERRHPVRISLVWTSIFMVIEALVGMLLVRLSLVGDDASVARAVVMPLHLVNTSLLLGALTLAVVAWYPKPSDTVPPARRGAWLVGLGLLAMLIVSASGAVTALGDTVYPVRNAFSGIAADPSGERHFLEQIRVAHPILAVAAVLALLRILPRACESGSAAAQRLGRLGLWLALGQAALGAVNVLLSAPGWMQVVHLLVACVLWITLVALAAELWAPRLPADFPFSWGSVQGRASGSSLEAGPASTRWTR